MTATVAAQRAGSEAASESLLLRKDDSPERIEGESFGEKQTNAGSTGTERVAEATSAVTATVAAQRFEEPAETTVC